MATSPRENPERKRGRKSFTGEKLLQPSSTIAKSPGAKGTHSYGQTFCFLGLRTMTGKVKVPEVDGPQPSRYVPDCNPGLIATELGNCYHLMRRLCFNRICQLWFIDKALCGGLEMFFEFTGPFKNHDLQDLLRSDENILCQAAPRRSGYLVYSTDPCRQ